MCLFRHLYLSIVLSFVRSFVFSFVRYFFISGVVSLCPAGFLHVFLYLCVRY